MICYVINTLTMPVWLLRTATFSGNFWEFQIITVLSTLPEANQPSWEAHAKSSTSPLWEFKVWIHFHVSTFTLPLPKIDELPSFVNRHIITNLSSPPDASKWPLLLHRTTFTQA